MIDDQPLELLAGILTAAIGMMQQRCDIPASRQATAGVLPCEIKTNLAQHYAICSALNHSSASESSFAKPILSHRLVQKSTVRSILATLGAVFAKSMFSWTAAWRPPVESSTAMPLS